ncbi:hypothetical protein HDU77_011849 [Chytriomyces hyalinus]|nr:hypothetical protein HDU77_011849 [Chytriomyces hyalinus]
MSLATCPQPDPDSRLSITDAEQTPLLPDNGSEKNPFIPRNNSKWIHTLNFEQSIATETAPKAALCIIWSLFVAAVFYKREPTASSAATYLEVFVDATENAAFQKCTGAVLSLLLAFRTKSSNEKYWDACKTWSLIRFHSVKLAIALKAAIKGDTAEELMTRNKCLDLVHGFPLSVKLRLQSQSAALCPDLAPHLQTLQDLGSIPTTGNIPVDIFNHLHSFLTQSNQISGSCISAMNALTDAYSHLERIADTRVPAAYSIQLEQYLVAYFCCFPFMFLDSLGWLIVAMTAICSYVMYGLLEIANVIECPFGSHLQHLPLDAYCDLIAREVAFIREREDFIIVAGELDFGWDRPLMRDPVSGELMVAWDGNRDGRAEPSNDDTTHTASETSICDRISSDGANRPGNLESCETGSQGSLRNLDSYAFFGSEITPLMASSSGIAEVCPQDSKLIRCANA